MFIKKPFIYKNIGSDLILWLTACAFAFIFFTMPCIADDLWYMSKIHDFKMGSAPWPGFSPLWETISWHYSNDNARLSNILYVLLMSLPPVVISLISSLVCAWVLFALRKFCGRSIRGIMGAVVVAALFSIMLPWDDGVFIRNFQLNYVWGLGLSVACVQIFLSPERKSFFFVSCSRFRMRCVARGVQRPSNCRFYCNGAASNKEICFSLEYRTCYRDACGGGVACDGSGFL